MTIRPRISATLATIVLVALLLPPRVAAQTARDCASSAADGEHSTGALLNLREYDRHGSVHVICGPGRTPVDIESTVDIEPDLAALIGPGGRLGVTSPEVQEAQASAATIAAMVAVLGPQLGRTTSLIEASARRLALVPQDTAAARRHAEALALHATLLLPILDTLERFDRAAVERALSTPDPTYAGLADVMRRKTAEVEAQLDAAARRALSQGRGYLVQLSAVRRSPGRAPVQLHLEGYDNLPQGDPRPIDRLAFARSADEQASLSSALAAYGLLASAINDARDHHRSAAEAVRRQAQLVADQLRAAGAALDSVPAAEAADAYAARLTTLPLRPIADELGRLAPTLRSIDSAKRAQAELVARFGDVTTPAVGLDELLRRIDLAARYLADTSRLTRPIAAFSVQVAALKDSAAALEARLTGADRDSLQRVREEALVPWSELAVRLSSRVQVVRQTAVGITELGTALGLLLGVATAPGTGGPLELDVLSVDAARARATSLDLTTVDQRHGDHIVITYRILDPDRTVTIVSESQILEVQTFGLHRRWSGALAFSRISRADGFRAGASASYLLHYRPRPDERTGELRGGERVWQGLDMGVGLTSVVTSSESNDVELGFGPTVSLLRDLIQVGTGYNLQQQKWYLLLSTPLLDVARTLADGGDSTTR